MSNIDKTHLSHLPLETGNPGFCANCNYESVNKYCPNCGEKKLDAHDFALKHYIEEPLEMLTHFDGKFFKSVKLLIIKPGQLSLYFSQGRRMAYIKPFQLFIICNIIFFLLAGSLNAFSISLYGFYNYTPYTYFGTQAMVDHIAGSPEQYKLLAAVFNEKIGTASKSFILVFIPLIGFFLAAYLYRSKRYLSEHLVFATHFFAFTLLFDAFWAVCVNKPFYYFFSGAYSSTFDLLSAIISFGVFGSYFAISAKRFYKISAAKATIGAVLICLVYMLVLTVYRLALFYKIIYSVHL